MSVIICVYSLIVMYANVVYLVLCFIHRFFFLFFLRVFELLFLFFRFVCCHSFFFFFLKQKTAYEMRISDWSSDVCSSDLVSGNDITRRIARQTMRIDGKVSRAIGINGTVPAPLVRLKEGQTARLTVVNDLDEDSSIHWHGLILPFQMDGVPGVSLPGIKPRSKFVYEFPVVQSGTYWYHRSEEHTSELQSLMRISYAVFCLKKKKS